MSESQADPGTWPGDRFEIDAVAIRDLSRAAAFEQLRAAMNQGQQVALGFCNANMLLKALCSASYASTLKNLVLLSDGIGLDLCSLLFRGRFFRENLNGTDFVPALLGGDARGRTLFLLGAKPGIAEAAARKLALLYPQHRVVGTRHGYFAPAETDAVIAEINAAAPDILLVALGNPDQETFIAEHAHRIDARLLMGVGALIDYTAGAAVRAPAPVRFLRLEWLYRLLREPRRLGRRYTIEAALFLSLIVRLRLATLLRARRAAALSTS
ncbi:WecB/TagA/CpsF family glycosyltransferase [Methylobacterium radiodurans]|uniref:Glycosyltransferase n=1 Tax=Methylobacterium radiodurans TaxID=2202828 RepID=A0A2U8VQ05_9HYPH|nr:WecB/TagA/CpsF family glycosyltransferase [Methylobacterium radiodurans]AWN35511.1 glycosyltransferase [Methylobacterium radiodurans]